MLKNKVKVIRNKQIHYITQTFKVILLKIKAYKEWVYNERQETPFKVNIKFRLVGCWVL